MAQYVCSKQRFCDATRIVIKSAGRDSATTNVPLGSDQRYHCTDRKTPVQNTWITKECDSSVHALESCAISVNASETDRLKYASIPKQRAATFVRLGGVEADGP